MKSYGKDSAPSVLRVVALAPVVERRMTGARMGFLQSFAVKLGLTPAHVTAVFADYEQDLHELQVERQGYFFGDAALPRRLVHRLLDELTHKDLRLQAAFGMMQLVMVEGDHTAKEVVFVESVVGYWRLNAEWHALVKEHEKRRGCAIRPVGAVR